MQSSISQELKGVFDLASRRHETKMLRKPIDWEKRKEITSRYKKLTEQKEKRYQDTYEHRVNKVMKQLINKAGSKQRDLTHPWFGTDNFDKDILQPQAHKIVRQEHQKQRNKLTESETSELKSLMKSVEKRDQLRDSTKQEFERMTDRRSGRERRNNPTRNR